MEGMTWNEEERAGRELNKCCESLGLRVCLDGRETGNRKLFSLMRTDTFRLLSIFREMLPVSAIMWEHDACFLHWASLKSPAKNKY